MLAALAAAPLAWSYYRTQWPRFSGLSSLPENATLAQVGDCTRTDKVLLGYTEYYPFILDRFRPLEFDLLEIGVQAEFSLHMWDWYFPKANVFGADKGGNYKSKRIFKCNQGVESDMRALAAARNWSVVIDDGSHSPRHQLNSFAAICPVLPPGGVYIIEDVETSYWEWGSKRAALRDWWSLAGETEQSDVVGRFLEARAPASVPRVCVFLLYRATAARPTGAPDG